MLSAGRQLLSGTVRRMAARAQEDEGPSATNRLAEFLATCVTYPALYIFATSAASPEELAKGQGPLAAELVPGAPAPPGGGRPTKAALRNKATAVLPGGGGGVPAAGGGDLAAQLQLQSAASGGLPLPGVLAVGPEARYRLSDFPEGRALVALERWCREPVALDFVSALWGHAREYARGCIAAGAAPPWLSSSLGPWLESQPDAPPPLVLEQVVEGVLRDAREGARAEEDSIQAGAGPTVPGGPAAVGWEGGLPLRRLAAAVAPHLHHIALQLQQRYRLTRGRTWLEFAQIFLGIFRSWLRLVAWGLSMLSTVLRLMGTGCTVLSGAVAFTVVFSIALSVLSALLTIGATAADATAMLLRRLAGATESVQSGSRRGAVRQQLEGDLVGPRTLEPASFEDLEDLFTAQLAPRLRLRSRPDAARLAGDPLLLRAYDLRLVGPGGEVLAEEPRAVEARFEAGGFFGLASAAARRAGAVLLLRLLSWKRVVAVCAPASPEALKYVFVVGERGAGRATTFAALAQLPADYEVSKSVAAEIRPIPRLPHAYALLLPGADSTDPRVAARASHLADLEHGVFSVVVMVVSVEGQAAEDRLAPPVWCALALGRPVLLLVNKGIKLTEDIARDPRVVELKRASWQEALEEGAARRGLEADRAAVLVAEMRDTPPAGVVGAQQVRSWLAAVLEQAAR